MQKTMRIKYEPSTDAYRGNLLRGIDEADCRVLPPRLAEQCERRVLLLEYSGTQVYRNVQRFRGGLVFEAHRRLYHSTLGLRVIKKKTAACFPPASQSNASFAFSCLRDKG